MAKYSKASPVSQETKDEALSIARGTQRPGQSKEQSKLIAQGIQKGIDQYKKQQKAKNRHLDKKYKKTTKHDADIPAANGNAQVTVRYKQHWLPWVMLVLSWIAMAAYQWY